MSNVTRLRHVLPMGQDINAAVSALDEAIADAVDAAKTLRKIADDLDAGEHPECTVGALTLIGPKGQVAVFGLGPKCDDLQCLGAMRLGEQKLIDVLLDGGEG